MTDQATGGWCNCIFSAHCNTQHPRCKLNAGGTISDGGGVCRPSSRSEVRKQAVQDPISLAHSYIDVCAERDRLRAALDQIARPVVLQGGLDAQTWMSLAQTTARRGLEPEYVADGSWSWDNAGPIRPGELGTPVPGSMAAAVAKSRAACDEIQPGEGNHGV